MHSDAERRFLYTVLAVVCLALTGAILFFAVKYAKENLYPPEAPGYYSIEYADYSDLNESVAAGSTIPLPDLEETGFSFGGWFLDEAHTIPVENGAVATSNMTLYPLLQVRRYVVTVHNYNGTDSVMLEYGSSFYIDYGSRIGHDFEGWYLDEEGMFPVDYVQMPAENLEIFARWRAKKYVVKYHVDDLPEIPDASVAYGTVINLPVREKTGYTFAGWYTNSGLTNPFPSGSTMPAETLHLYPKFTVNTYTVTFMDSDMETELLPSRNVQFGADLSYLYADGSYNASIVPVKEGNVFLYWHLEGVDEPYEFTTMPAEGITLFASWLHI